MKAKLTVELVPKTVWFKNLRSELSQEEWDKLRKTTYKAAGYKCEVCGGKGPKWPVDAHEIWEYDDENKIQKLLGLTALCPSCHSCKHIGLAQVKGNYERARKHLAKVNGWSEEDAEHYIQAQFEIWAWRSEFDWKLDLSWLEKVGDKE